MKKTIGICFALAFVAGALLAGTTFLDWPANGSYQSGIGPAKVVGVDIVGAVSNQTVIIRRITPDGTATNDIGTVVCSNAIEQIKFEHPGWIFADDIIVRSGTATGARVRLILEQ